MRKTVPCYELICIEPNGEILLCGRFSSEELVQEEIDKLNNTSPLLKTEEDKKIWEESLDYCQNMMLEKKNEEFEELAKSVGKDPDFFNNPLNFKERVKFLKENPDITDKLTEAQIFWSEENFDKTLGKVLTDYLVEKYPGRWEELQIGRYYAFGDAPFDFQVIESEFTFDENFQPWESTEPKSAEEL
jgi:hypothetical protein